MFRNLRCLRLLKVAGILPVKQLCERFKFSRMLRLPKPGETLPVNLLLLKSAGEILPFNWLKYKLISTTLFFSTVIPYHLFTGFTVSQFVLFFQCSPPVLLYKSTRARESCLFTCASMNEGIINASRIVIRVKKIFIKCSFSLVWCQKWEPRIN